MDVKALSDVVQENLDFIYVGWFTSDEMYYIVRGKGLKAVV